MKILILNQDWFAQEFRELGHEAVTAGFTFAKHLDITFDIPLIHIDRVIQSLPNDFRPDVILVLDNSSPIAFSGLDETELPVVFYSVDTHHHSALHRYLAQVFDYTFVAQRDYIPFMEEWGSKAEWLPLWASRHVEASEDKKHGAVFVGTLDERLNPDRVRFFKELGERAPVLCTMGEYWKIFPYSEIVINQTVKSDLNFRVFESMMCGAMLLTERGGNGLLELFEDGVHLATYEKGNVKEAADKIHRYLQSPAEARRIARAGREEILRAHTPRSRARRILEVLSSVKKKNSDQRFYSMMVNHTCLARSKRDIEPATRILALTSALKAAECAINHKERIDNAISCHLVIAAHEYDRYCGGSSGYEFLWRVHEMHPEEQVLNIAMVRAALNHGHIDKAKTIVDSLGIDDMHATYENAEKIIRSLLDNA